MTLTFLEVSETVRDRLEAWFQRTTNREWPMGINGHVIDNVKWPERSDS